MLVPSKNTRLLISFIISILIKNLNDMSFELPALNYNADSLEPHIDTKTMEIHHGKHHAGYTNNLNNAIKGTDLEGGSIEEILTGLDLNNSAVRNNGGGYF